ncbi:sulfite exporter TauE/SafE family protein [Alicyclobacillus sp. ALC3]|uniref:sulfite exporter TauE/SafE family protein n=1 Tax=Alicyclobacillus sp. ALC3 TaxID=2796143 RepID=UPI0023780181|nr:sulfite exporter TauE/SafE family protein [Alicyclobacillus sp. ALC3]WDL95512.1 sulfite exporter TauE/SafE family protein [Alicyclobacillus sp. ALC3]
MPHLSALQILLSIVSGGIVGFTLGLIGGGGSILAVPLLLYLVGIHDPHVVIGSTALAVSVNAFMNLIPHWRAGHIRWKAAVMFAVPGAIGAYVGSIFGKMVNDSEILFLFAILMIIIAVLMLRQRQGVDEVPDPHVRPLRVVPVGLSTGAVAGFFGIGGGFLIVPGLLFSTGMGLIEAIANSLFSVGTFGLTTAISYAASGLVDWFVVILYIVGGFAGGIIGARFATRMSQNKRYLQIVFSAVIILVACYMLYKNPAAIRIL